MSNGNDLASEWQPPNRVIRVRWLAEDAAGIRCLSEVRDAFRNPCGYRIRLVEVKEGPDLLLLVGTVEWAEAFILSFRGGGDLTPTVVLNAGAGNGSSARILDAGADDCLACPFEPGDLRARIHAVMRRLGRAFPPYADVAADRTSLRIRVCGVETRVSRRQFEIFVCLAEHRERWVHSDEIIATVSGTHHASTTSLVRVQIHALRKALRAARECIRCDGRRSYMLTLAGYERDDNSQITPCGWC